jgi:hypothetical protein
MIVHKSHRIDGTLLHDRSIKYLPDVIAGTLIPSLLKVIVKRGVEHAELLSKFCEVSIEIIQGILPIFSHGKQLRVSRFVANMLDELCDKL